MKFRNPVLILLAVAIFISATGALEFTKLPHLISHYKEHKQDFPKDSFLDYLTVHYAHNSKHQDDHKDKGCLPFQGDHSAFFNSSQFYFENSSTQIMNESGPVEQTIIPYTASFISQFSSSIWQPPKSL